MDPSLHRLRVAYRKRDRLAYLGHLEVLHTVERSVRRSGLPFAVSSGFARRMRLQFSQALPVGAASDAEYYDVGLMRRVGPSEALAALVSATPSQLAPFSCGYVPASMRALEAWLTRSTWELLVGGEGPLSAAALDAALRSVAHAGTIAFMRGDKPRTVELAHTLVGWEARDVGGAGVALRLETCSSERGALRPAVLLDVAFARPELADVRRSSTLVTRTAQHHEDFEGNLVDAFDVTISRIATWPE